MLQFREKSFTSESGLWNYKHRRCKKYKVMYVLQEIIRSSWKFFFSCLFFGMHGMNYTSLKQTTNKEKQNS